MEDLDRVTVRGREVARRLIAGDGAVRTQAVWLQATPARLPWRVVKRRVTFWA